MRPELGDRGQLAGAEAIPFGLLVFVIGTLLVVNAWAVVDAKFAVDAAAQAAARSFAESTGTWSDAFVDARVAGRSALAAHGRDPAKLSFETDGDGLRGDDPVRRCVRVSFEAHYAVPAIRVPFVGGFGDGFDVSASHSRIVDPLRSGIDGEATCL